MLTDVKNDSDSQADAWSFFERLAGAQARCVVCRDLVPRAALREHLRGQHPKLLDAVDSEEDTTNNPDEVYTEVVYLDNEDTKENDKRTSTEKLAKPRKTKKRRISSSSDEEPLKLKKDRQDDEIEQFGKYVTCLLKKVPHEACMELQMDIVNLILKKQLESTKQTHVSPGYKMAAVQTDDWCANDGISNGCTENVGEDK